jgi:hypothetical protein
MDDAGEIPWHQLADAEFVARALPVAEGWRTAAQIESRILFALDDEVEQRLQAQRARRRRAGAHGPAADTDLRPLSFLMLMALERAWEQGGAPMMVTRALRLAGLHALCCLVAAEPISAPIWIHAHRMYLRAEATGEASIPTDLGIADETLYLRMLLLSTLAGNGMSARQIDKSFDWLEGWSRGVLLESAFDPARHYFTVDLDAGAGLQPVDSGTMPGAPRYLDHARMVERVAAARADYFRVISVSTIGLYASNPLFEYHDALHQLNRYWDYVAVRHSGKDTGRQLIEQVEVAAVAGFDRCVAVARTGSGAERWNLVDISPTGAGFSVGAHADPVAKGALALFADPDGRGWMLGTAVRVAVSTQGGSIGVRRFADAWRPVVLHGEVSAGDPAAVEPQTPCFFVFGDEARGLADSIILRAGTFDPSRTFTMRPGRDLFRIRLSRVIQSGGDWERVGFDVLKRFEADR